MFGCLHLQVQDLKESDMELKLILEMYRREFTDSRLENLHILFFLVHISNDIGIATLKKTLVIWCTLLKAHNFVQGC